jgi:uncharacterized protein
VRKLISLAALTAFLTVSVTPAHAADAPAPATAAAPIPPAKLALLARLDKAMNYERMSNQTMSAIMPGMVDSMRRLLPELTEEKGKILTASGLQVMQKYTPRMKEVLFRSYADVLTETELTALIVFYESPEGQAYLEKLPRINQQSVALMSDLMFEMQKEMIRDVCGKIECKQGLKDRVKE